MTKHNNPTVIHNLFALLKERSGELNLIDIHIIIGNVKRKRLVAAAQKHPILKNLLENAIPE
jgi:hypothetical protein